MTAFFGLLTLLAGASLDGERVTPTPGNVLILVADDLGVDQLRAYGLAPNPPPTPNIDRLVAAGVLFRNALPLSEITLPEMLDLGTGGLYAHAAIGKWHLSTNQNGGDLAPNLAGYSHFAGSVEGQINSYTNWRRVEDGVVGTSTRYATSACVDDALAWITRQAGPWLCLVGFQAPHMPFHRPPAALHTQTLPAQAPSPLCDSSGSDPYPFYRATIEALDHEIGRLLRKIPRDELERTTVFFLADNGTDHCMVRPPFPSAAKGSLYQGGVNVPLIAAGYRVTGRGVSQALVNTSDLFATVAELAGVDLAATLPGLTLDSRSFVPALADPARSARRFVYAEMFSENGPGNPRPLPPCPTTSICQTSLGIDGPGNATLSSCGRPLYGRYGANTVPWSLSGAPPFAPAWLLIGANSPALVPALDATVASPSPEVILPFVVGPTGRIDGWTWTYNTSREHQYQFVVQDRTQPRGFSVTDALRMELLWSNMQAVRGVRYKLIRLDPCSEELYDLRVDPYERTNLLARSLTPPQRKAYDLLGRVMDEIRR